MQALLQAIATVQVRIQAHRPIYANSELQTRYGLIDPILRGLEWDTSNPEEVRVEYNTDSGKADYVLFHQGKPLVVVEAKVLGALNPSEKLSSVVISQGIPYCEKIEVSIFVCTDGDTWQIYHIEKPTKVTLLHAVHVSRLRATGAFEKLIFLWKPVICSPQPYELPIFVDSELSLEKPAPEKGVAHPIPLPDGSINLSELQKRLPQRGKAEFKYNTIYFNDSTNTEKYNIINFTDILRKVVLYADKHGLIPTEGVQNIVLPRLPSGQNAGYYQELKSHSGKKWYIHTHANPKRIVLFAIRVLNACQIDPSTVYVS